MNASFPTPSIAPTATDGGMSSRQLPRLVGQYELFECIGEGGMGTVYKARHVHLNAVVAFKLLPWRKTGDAEAVSRFYSEMQAIGQLVHPNIVRATDAREVDGEHFLVMEYVDGPNLGQLVRRFGPLPAPLACEIVLQAARGLKAIHDRNLIHRDIKPTNLALAHDGVVKVLDLGLAKLNSCLGNTSTGQVMGTLDYMSKEQAENSKAVDIRADIYSLGCTLFCLLTGQAPFSRYSSPTRKLQAILIEEIPPLPEREDITPELRLVLERMTAKDPKDRFSTPEDVIRAVAPLAGGDLTRLAAEWDEPGSHSSTGLNSSKSLISASVETDQITVTPVPQVERRQNRLRWMLAGLSFIACLAIAGAFLSPPEPKFDPVIPRQEPPKTSQDLPDKKSPFVPQAGGGVRIREIPLQPDSPATWKIVGAGKEILFSSRETTLLSLGKTDGPADNLEMAAQIHQLSWTGRIGFFFHFRPATIPGFAWQFEVIEIERLSPESQQLIHRFCLVTQSNSFRRFHLASKPLSALSDVRKDLEIGFLNGKLNRVIFDGAEFAEFRDAPHHILTPEAKTAYAQSLWGEYGVIGDSGTATFSKIRVDEEDLQLED